LDFDFLFFQTIDEDFGVFEGEPFEEGGDAHGLVFSGVRVVARIPSPDWCLQASPSPPLKSKTLKT
jgi:hypothetical protein